MTDPIRQKAEEEAQKIINKVPHFSSICKCDELHEAITTILESLMRKNQEFEDLLKEGVGGFFEPIQKLMNKNQELEQNLISRNKELSEAVQKREELESKLAKAVEGLQDIEKIGTKGAMHIGDTGYFTQECTIAKEVLKEIEGCNDAERKN